MYILFISPITNYTLQELMPTSALLVTVRNRIPVDYIPPGVQILGTAILVLKIVGMLPDIVTHHRIHTTHERAVLISCRDDLQFSIRVKHKPCPTRAETLGASIIKSRFESIEGTKYLLDSAGKVASRFATTIGRHDIPEHAMVRVTTCVILHSRANTLRYLFNVAQQIINGHSCKLVLTLQRVIHISDIRLMVLVMVYLHGLCVDVRL